VTRRPYLFALGVLVVVAAVVPPFDHEASERFSMHMLQHMVLVLVAAPLLAGSGVLVPRSRLMRSVGLVVVLHAVALWVWHLPKFYDAAMSSDPLHVLEHASFLITAVLFWMVVLDGALDRFKRVGVVFATMLQSGALGALIAFASSPLYGWHRDASASPDRVLADQQLAGAIMWVPPGVLYLVVMLVLLARALSAFDTAEQR